MSTESTAHPQFYHTPRLAWLLFGDADDHCPEAATGWRNSPLAPLIGVSSTYQGQQYIPTIWNLGIVFLNFIFIWCSTCSDDGGVCEIYQWFQQKAEVYERGFFSHFVNTQIWTTLVKIIWCRNREWTVRKKANVHWASHLAQSD